MISNSGEESLGCQKPNTKSNVTESDIKCIEKIVRYFIKFWQWNTADIWALKKMKSGSTMLLEKHFSNLKILSLITTTANCWSHVHLTLSWYLTSFLQLNFKNSYFCYGQIMKRINKQLKSTKQRLYRIKGKTWK